MGVPATVSPSSGAPTQMGNRSACNMRPCQCNPSGIDGLRGVIRLGPLPTLRHAPYEPYGPKPCPCRACRIELAGFYADNSRVREIKRLFSARRFTSRSAARTTAEPCRTHSKSVRHMPNQGARQASTAESARSGGGVVLAGIRPSVGARHMGVAPTSSVD